TANCMVAYFDGSVGLFPAANALKKVLDMRFGRNAPFVFHYGLRPAPILRPRLGVDSVPPVVELHRSFPSLKNNRPAVMVGVPVSQSPRGQEYGILVDCAEGIGHIGSDQVVCRSVTLSGNRRLAVTQVPLDHVHQVRPLARAVPAGIVPEV